MAVIALELDTEFSVEPPISLDIDTHFSVSRTVELELDTGFRSNNVVELELDTFFSVAAEVALELDTEFSVVNEVAPVDIAVADPEGVGFPDIRICGPGQYVIGPGIDTQWVSAIEVGEDVNGGWSWNINYEDEFDIEFAEDAPFLIRLEDGEGGFFESASLVATRRDEDWEGSDVPSITLGGIDRTMWRASNKGQNLGSFFNMDSTQIASVVAGAAGFNFSGLDNFFVGEEDINHSNYIDPMRRFGAAAGQDFKIRRDGTMAFFRADSVAGAYDGCLYSHGRSVNTARALNELRIEKQSRITFAPQCYPFDLPGYYTIALERPLLGNTAFWRDYSASGFIDVVGFWHGPPGSEGSRLLKFFSPMNLPTSPPPTFNDGSDVTHISLGVFPPASNLAIGLFGGATTAPTSALFCIDGTPSGVGVRGSITASQSFSFLATDGLGNRRSSQVWSEPLLPNESFASERSALYLRMRRRGWKPIRATAPLALGVGLTQTLPARGLIPVGRVLGYKHSFRSGRAETTITAEAA